MGSFQRDRAGSLSRRENPAIALKTVLDNGHQQWEFQE
jgi:hypothetical protein